MYKTFRIITFLIYILSSFYSRAQNDTVYYTNEGLKTEWAFATFYGVTYPEIDGKKKIEMRTTFKNKLVLISYINSQFGWFEGTFVTYDIKGDKTQEGNYIDNKRIGLWKIYYASSDTVSVAINYSDNQINNELTAFYKNGSIKSHINCINDTFSYNIMLYDSITHNKIEEGNMLYKERNGKWMFYYAQTGELKGMENYKYGLCDGAAIYYDSITHNVASKGKYLNGEMTGVWGYYSSAGILRSILNYENGLCEGDATYYDTISNKKITEGNFHNDKKAGVWTNYYNNRNKRDIENYKDGKLNGDAISYYIDGTMQRKEHYVDDKSTGGECYNENGEMIPYFPLPLQTIIAFINTILLCYA